MKSSHVDKEQWVDMFRDIGLSEDAMRKWHQLFEEKNPEGHQEFLEWLNIPNDEIRKIRAL
jgi:hypothetical protein